MGSPHSADNSLSSAADRLSSADNSLGSVNNLRGLSDNDPAADPRNLIDRFKGLDNAAIIKALSQTRLPLEIAIENLEHDFNIGSIVRTANSFNVAKVHIIGKKKYNRRGAMCTDKYLEILHHPDLASFLATQQGRELIAVENNVDRAQPLHIKHFAERTTLIFGSENSGLTPELLAAAHDVRYIESFGSTRSVNVGVAAGIAMYEYVHDVLFRSAE